MAGREVGAIGRIPSFLATHQTLRLIRYDAATDAPLRGPDGFCIVCEPDEPGEAIARVTETTTAQFHADIDALGTLRPTSEPRATEHIEEMKAIIERLKDTFTTLCGAAPGQIAPDEYAEAEALVASKFATDAWLHRVP